VALDQLLTVVIPAFNEQDALAAVLTDLHANCRDVVGGVIVVDDGSSDDTAAVAREHGATVVAHPTNLGYGAALKTGIRHAETAFVATMDADGQHSGAAIRRMWERRHEGDMVVGARIGLVHSRAWRMPGKWLLTLMAVYLTRRRIPDLNSGLRVYRADVLRKYIHLCPNGFSFTTTTTLALMSRGWRVVYVPFDILPRRGTSTVSVVTGLETIVLILRIVALFHPLRVFVPAAAVIGAGGIIWGLPIALVGRGISVGSMLAIVTAVILFALGLLCDQLSQLRLERFE
jgi:glycosyltransferase involved in cell wall biosynthesis